MKKIIVALVLTVLVFSAVMGLFGDNTGVETGVSIVVPAYAGKGGVDTSAAAAVLCDAESGRLLYAGLG